MAIWPSVALVGPALAGLLLAAADSTAVFATNAATTIAALLSIVTLHCSVPGSPADGPRFGDGLRYLLRVRWPLGLQLVMLCAASLTIGIETLLPANAVTTFSAGPAGYALLRIAPGIGAVVVALTLSRLSTNPRRPLRALAMTSAVAGLAALGFGRASQLPVAVGALIIAGVTLTATQILIGTHLQQSIPIFFLGSVGGLNAISQSGLAGVAAAGMATLAQAHGPAAVITTAALISIPLTSAGFYFARTTPSSPLSDRPLAATLHRRNES